MQVGVKSAKDYNERGARTNRWGAACGEREVIKRLMSTTRCTWKKRRRRKKHKMSDVKHNE